MSQPSPLQVKFPEKMTVESPGTDHQINAFREAFLAFSKMLQKGFTEICDALQTLKQLPELVEQMQQTVVKQFSSLSSRQMEAQLFQRHAAILAAQKKRDILDGRRQEKSVQMSEDRRRITGRYERLLSQVAEETGHRIRRLDSHAFDLVENVYPRQIQNQFSLYSTPEVEFLAAHADESACARTVCLEEGAGKALGAMSCYLDARQAAFRQIQESTVAGSLQPGSYRISFLAVESVEPSGIATRWEIFPDPGEYPQGMLESVVKTVREAVLGRVADMPRRPLEESARRLLIENLSAVGKGKGEESIAASLQAGRVMTFGETE